MIEDKLEIVIPTYNRSKLLDRTLESLLDSPFNKCKITIRNNASTDNTIEIFDKYSKLFDNLQIINNDKNIGGDANIVYSYQGATSPYVWVLSDNDILIFDECEDVLNAIESEKYAVIMCCSSRYCTDNTDHTWPTVDDESISELIKMVNHEKENPLENTAQDLVSIIGGWYLSILTFLPSSIFKTSLIDSDVLMKSYDNIPYYANLPLPAKILNENHLTYKSDKDLVIMQKNPKESKIESLAWYCRFLESSLLIDEKFRGKLIGLGCKNFIYHTFSNLIVTKASGSENVKDNFIDLMRSTLKLKGWVKGTFYNLIFFCCYLIPKRLCIIITNMKFKNNPDMDLIE